MEHHSKMEARHASRIAYLFPWWELTLFVDMDADIWDVHGLDALVTWVNSRCKGADDKVRPKPNLMCHCRRQGKVCGSNFLRRNTSKRGD